MEIRTSTLNDLDAILGIYAQARAFMAAHGNPDQWGNTYPEVSLVERDVANKQSYVCMQDGEIVATFMYALGTDPAYANIYQGEWVSSAPYGVVHRITSVAGKRGVASFCLDWCYKQCGNIRIDTHRDNIPMQNMLSKNGLIRCGIIYLEDGDERIAFQKTEG